MKNVKIQILRAISIFCVVIIHTYPYNQLGIFLRPFVNFAVPVFVFLSGFLTKIEIDDVKKFYKKRILRITIPYIIWSIIYTIFHKSYSSFFYNLIMGSATGPFYYIITYLQLVLITPLLSKIANSKYKYLGFLVTPLALILKIFVTIFNIRSGLFYEVYNFLGIIRWFTYYYMGIMLSNGKIKIKLSNIKLYILGVFSVVFQILVGEVWYFAGNYSMATSAGKLSAMFTSIVVLCIIYRWLTNSKEISAKNKKICEFLVTIGDYSFGIYLSHIFVMETFMRYAPFGIPFPLNTIFYFSLTLICAILGRKIVGDKFSRWLGLI